MKEKEKEAKRYRVYHLRTKTWWDGEAGNAAEACELAGFHIGDCQVKEFKHQTGKYGGWGKSSPCQIPFPTNRA